MLKEAASLVYLYSTWRPLRFTYFDFRPVEAMDNLRTNIESPTPLHPPLKYSWLEGQKWSNSSDKSKHQTERDSACTWSVLVLGNSTTKQLQQRCLFHLPVQMISVKISQPSTLHRDHEQPRESLTDVQWAFFDVDKALPLSNFSVGECSSKWHDYHHHPLHHSYCHVHHSVVAQSLLSQKVGSYLISTWKHVFMLIESRIFRKAWIRAVV